MKKSFLVILAIALTCAPAFSQNTQSNPKRASQKDVAVITSLARSNFNVAINPKMAVYGIENDNMKIIAAPVLDARVDKDKWQNIAVVTFALVQTKSETNSRPFGTYLLQYNGTTGRYIDNKGNPTGEAPTSTSPTITGKIGWVYIDNSYPSGPRICWQCGNAECCFKRPDR